jgi:hypothetical protein
MVATSLNNRSISPIFRSLDRRVFSLAPRRENARLRVMKILLPVALAAAILTGCAAIERADRRDTEKMLSAAGFQVLPANTPQRQASLTELAPNTISRQIRGNDVFYVFPDPEGNFLMVGDQAAYSRYENLMQQQQISDQNLMAAQMATMPGMWGGWGYYGY